MTGESVETRLLNFKVLSFTWNYLPNSNRNHWCAVAVLGFLENGGVFTAFRSFSSLIASQTLTTAGSAQILVLDPQRRKRTPKVTFEIFLNSNWLLAILPRSSQTIAKKIKEVLKNTKRQIKTETIHAKWSNGQTALLRLNVACSAGVIL